MIEGMIFPYDGTPRAKLLDEEYAVAARHHLYRAGQSDQQYRGRNRTLFARPGLFGGAEYWACSNCAAAALRNWGSSRAIWSNGKVREHPHAGADLPQLAGRINSANRADMNFLGKIFTWWNGATIGTHWWAMPAASTSAPMRRATSTTARRPAEGARERRWVIYDGANDASRVPSEWHGWLHGAFDDVPESHLPPARIWEADFTPNATGTAMPIVRRARSSVAANVPARRVITKPGRPRRDDARGASLILPARWLAACEQEADAPEAASDRSPRRTPAGRTARAACR